MRSKSRTALATCTVAALTVASCVAFAGTAAGAKRQLTTAQAVRIALQVTEAKTGATPRKVQVVRTTRTHALEILDGQDLSSLPGGIYHDPHPVFLVIAKGHFVANGVSRDPGAAAPRGTVWFVSLTADTGLAADFGLQHTLPDLRGLEVTTVDVAATKTQGGDHRKAPLLRGRRGRVLVGIRSFGGPAPGHRGHFGGRVLVRRAHGRVVRRVKLKPDERDWLMLHAGRYTIAAKSGDAHCRARKIRVRAHRTRHALVVCSGRQYLSSPGSPVVVVPSTQGLDLQDAYKRLHRAGLRVRIPHRISSWSLGLLGAYAQSPRAGRQVKPSAVVTLRKLRGAVGSPSAMPGVSATVPAFVGKRVSAAVHWARNHSLYWRVAGLPALPAARTQAPTLFGNYRIIRQIPAPGSTLTAGRDCGSRGSASCFHPTPVTVRGAVIACHHHRCRQAHAKHRNGDRR